MNQDIVNSASFFGNKKGSRFWQPFSICSVDDYLLTVFAKSAPALNLATFLAAILIAFPV